MPSTTAWLPTSPALISMFFGFSFGFAQVPAGHLPDGVMPKHKRAASTGSSNASSQPGNNVSSVPPSTTSHSPTTTPTSLTTTHTSLTTTTSPTKTATSTPATTATTTPITTKHTTTTPTTTTTTKKPTVSSTPTIKHSSSKTTSKPTITPSSDIVRLSSTTVDRATLSHKSTITHALVTSHTDIRTFTSTFVVHGTTHSSLVTQQHVVASTTGFTTSTILPTLADGGGNGGNLSTHDKTIIGGVVGGVGSAIVLIGLGLVAFRLWGRKKRRGDADGDYFDSQNDSIHNEKNTAHQQYSDGLERYRLGGAASPNTASNF